MKTLINGTYQSETRPNHGWIAFALAMSFLVFTSGCRLVDGSDPGANELILRSIALDANCSGNAIMAEGYTCEPKLTDASLVDSSQVVWQFSSEHTCSWMMINPITGQIFGTPDRLNLGNCVMAVNVIASEKPTDAFILPIKVSGPKITFVENNCPLTVAVDQTYNCDYHATTPLKDAVLNWSLAVDNKCAWATIDAATGIVKGVPPLGASGSCVLSINVSVESMSTANLKKNIAIPKVPVTISANCPAVLDAGTTYGCAPYASAPVTSPKFTWSLTSNNTCGWAQINAISGQISGTPAVHAVGNCTLGFAAQLGSDTPTQSTAKVVVRARGYSELYLLESAGSVNDGSGFSVSIDGNWAAVGMPKANSGSGAVLVYQYDGTTWNKRAILGSPDPAKFKSLGYSVSVSGTTIMVGAPDSQNPTFKEGAVLIYDLVGSTWNLSQTLRQGNSSQGHFGASVDLDGAQAIVGTSHFNVPAAHILRKTNGVWSVSSTLDFPAVGSANGPTRVKVAIHGSIAAVSDSKAGAGQYGEVRIFRWNGSLWNADGTLPATAGSDFGVSLDVSEGRVLVGAPGDRTDTGSAYLYENSASTWVNTKIFRAPDETVYRRFGQSVSLKSGVIAIGSPSENVAGSAYVYKLVLSDWALDSKFAPAGGQSLDNFGGSVSITGTTIMVGAPMLDTSGAADTGAAYIYKPR